MSNLPFERRWSTDGKTSLVKCSGRIALMCPNCKALVEVEHSGSVTITADASIDPLPKIKYMMTCGQCGDTVLSVSLDIPIAQAVAKLNKLGYRTMGSCCSVVGDPVYIEFVWEEPWVELPVGWHRDKLKLVADTLNVEQAVQSLLNWIDTLQPSTKRI